MVNIISGSLALVFIRHRLVLYADAANFTATVLASQPAISTSS
jgi:hypothetical protein